MFVLSIGIQYKKKLIDDMRRNHNHPSVPCVRGANVSMLYRSDMESVFYKGKKTEWQVI